MSFDIGQIVCPSVTLEEAEGQDQPLHEAGRVGYECVCVCVHFRTGSQMCVTTPRQWNCCRYEAHIA